MRLYQYTDRLPCTSASGWVWQLGDPFRGLKDEKRAWSEYPFPWLHPSQVPTDWLPPFTKVIAAVRHPLHARTFSRIQIFLLLPSSGLWVVLAPGNGSSLSGFHIPRVPSLHSPLITHWCVGHLFLPWPWLIGNLNHIAVQNCLPVSWVHPWVSVYIAVSRSSGFQTL